MKFETKHDSSKTNNLYALLYKEPSYYSQLWEDEKPMSYLSFTQSFNQLISSPLFLTLAFYSSGLLPIGIGFYLHKR